jgi:hypothetical protein
MLRRAYLGTRASANSGSQGRFRRQGRARLRRRGRNTVTQCYRRARELNREFFERIDPGGTRSRQRVGHARNRLLAMHAIRGEVHFAPQAINILFGEAD